jgi:hypothetical protein
MRKLVLSLVLVLGALAMSLGPLASNADAQFRRWRGYYPAYSYYPSYGYYGSYYSPSYSYYEPAYSYSTPGYSYYAPSYGVETYSYVPSASYYTPGYSYVPSVGVYAYSRYSYGYYRR